MTSACVSLDSVLVPSNSPPILVTGLLIDSTFCNFRRSNGNPDGSIQLLTFSDHKVKQVYWSNGDSGLTISGVPAGLYTANIIDSMGCMGDSTIKVPFKHFVQAIVSPRDTEVCWNTEAIITGQGGTKLVWSNSGSNADSIAKILHNGDTIVTKKILSPLNYFILTASDSVCYSVDSARLLTYTRQLFEIQASDTIAQVGGTIQLNVVPDTMTKRFSYYIISPDINVQSSTAYSTKPSYEITAVPLQQNAILPDYITYTIFATAIAKYGGCTEAASVKISIVSGPVPQTLFTPNGDGRNDYWVIKDGALYPNMKCEVFNRWGDLVYEKVGCSQTIDGNNCEVWNGYRNGVRVPCGTYYYVVNLGNGSPALTGTLTVVY